MFEDLEMKYNEIAGKQSTLEAKLRLATDSYRHAVEGMESSKEVSYATVSRGILSYENK